VTPPPDEDRHAGGPASKAAAQIGASSEAGGSCRSRGRHHLYAIEETLEVHRASRALCLSAELASLDVDAHEESADNFDGSPDDSWDDPI
jgi:hypothetical protein